MSSMVCLNELLASGEGTSGELMGLCRVDGNEVDVFDFRKSLAFDRRDWGSLDGKR